MGKLDGKVALVTGASKGIGAGIALSLAKEGAAVAVNYASDREGADRVVEKIKAAGGKAIAVQGNVTVVAGDRSLLQRDREATRQCGRPCQQRRRLRLPALAGHKRKGVSPPV